MPAPKKSPKKTRGSPKKARASPKKASGKKNKRSGGGKVCDYLAGWKEGQECKVLGVRGTGVCVKDKGAVNESMLCSTQIRIPEY